jgi:hypothetical protein
VTLPEQPPISSLANTTDQTGRSAGSGSGWAEAFFFVTNVLKASFSSHCGRIKRPNVAFGALDRTNATLDA